MRCLWCVAVRRAYAAHGTLPVIGARDPRPPIQALTAYPQVKSPAPNNTWAATNLSANPLVGKLGAWGGMSGALALDGQQAHVHCGGVDVFNDDELSRGCFALRVDSSGEVVVDSLAALPQHRRFSCYGSDGGRLAVAGGLYDK